jgi:hypothetical protein
MRFPWRWTLSLKAKLALTLTLAALLPLLLFVSFGAYITLERLERGVMTQARETARIAFNLLLNKVQQISQETVRLAAHPELYEHIVTTPELVPRFLQTYVEQKKGSLVEVALTDRTVVGRVGANVPAFQALHSTPQSAALSRALNYERYFSL